ncbi:SubName: Full=Uncharacterized protein {ECO:0000313/EMBL:CCA67206.1} [Serendipita indica DSM 11827]|nr:SubName: Full=Uncharacterized protein {ECO:0000313/EMBL:CCA67206.1} [Serendipita indica DSM 11827]
MFSASRSMISRASMRSFSTSASRSSDVAKVILVGRLGREPEVRTTKSEKEYVSYVVATTNYPPPPPSADGTRPDPGTTWHRVLCFNPNMNNYLRTLTRGTRVYVEANLEVRDPQPDAPAGSSASMRQVFLRHEALRVLDRKQQPRDESKEESRFPAASLVSSPSPKAMDDNQENSELTLNHPKGKRGPSSSSCAECKRLKIRCSGATKAPFPCTSCIKRGVESVCPNGVIPERQRRKEAGEGDILRRRNQALTARIKELEAALAKATGGTAESPSSSGTQDSEATLKDPDDHALVESFGTLTIEDSGRTNWHGAHSPAINLLPSEEPVNVIGFQDQVFDESLPPELSLIAAAFPFTAPTVAATNMKEALRSFAPSYEEAVELCNCFFIHAAWLGTPCTRERFLAGIVVPLYAAGSWESERPDVLALFFASLAVGCMFDQRRPQYDPFAFRLNKLCAAALALAKPIDRPTITALEALQIHLFFHQLSDRPLAVSRLWTLSSLAFRMAQSLGLHRDSRAWGLDPALDQRRRWLFWQLNFMDGVIALSYGRPRFFSPRHYDCPLPNESFRPDLLGFGTWRFQFLRDALIPVLEEAFSVQPPPTYATIMRLDKKIRDLPTLDMSTISIDLASMTAPQCMQLFCVGGIKKLAILYLHRRFLFEAASDTSCADMMTHKYAYSVQAGFQTSLAMVKQLRGLFAKDPIIITLATLLIKRPESEFAETALREMNSIIEMYQKAGSSHRAQRCLVPMLVLRDKGQSILTLNRTGHTIKAPLDAHLETLLGGTPVVLKTNRGHCAYSDPVPPPLVTPATVDTNYDLEALLGNDGATPPKFFEASPPTSNQPIDPMSFNWNQPVQAMPVGDTRVFEGMDDLVANYLRGQNGLFDAGQGPDWETLLGTMT